jgi:molybdate/tungstate transport system substrate-binding protein
MMSSSVSVIVVVGFLLLTLLSVSSYGHTSSIGWIVSATATTLSPPTFSPNQQREPVSVMYAASLIKTFEETLAPAFQEDTGYPYQGEARGSLQIANMILDGLRRPDVFVSAGTIPIKKIMDETDPLVDWLVKFGSAEMVIAYTPRSRFFDDLENARTGEIPWYEVVSKPGLKFGRTDPELDPKGYYMIISAELANKYYNDSGLKQRILGEDRNPAQIFPEETLKTILEQGQLDAAAAYKHEAVARGLPYIALPAEINLADPALSNLYKTASYTLDDGNGQTVIGEPIYFSFTIPNTVKNLEGATSFGEFILSNAGRVILESEGLNPIEPVIEGSTQNVPPVIKNGTVLAASAVANSP